MDEGLQKAIERSPQKMRVFLAPFFHGKVLWRWERGEADLALATNLFQKASSPKKGSTTANTRLTTDHTRCPQKMRVLLVKIFLGKVLEGGLRGKLLKRSFLLKISA
jgi:hypothetical protein